MKREVRRRWNAVHPFKEVTRGYLDGYEFVSMDDA